MSPESELSVLLIEDEPDAARLIQFVLSKGGGTPVAVDWAGDLRTGLERLAEGDFHAVLLDLNLPDSTGFATFASGQQRAADRAIIVLTGHEDEALALEAVRAGADEYLMKSGQSPRTTPSNGASSSTGKYGFLCRRNASRGREPG